jgi:hypothetical protein
MIEKNMAELTREEYERRHAELSALVVSHIARVDARIDKVEQTDLAAKTQLDAKFEKLTDKIDNSEKLLSSQISTLKDDIYRTRTSDLWRVISWGVSFLLGGGGVFGLLQVLHLLK